VFNVRVRCSTLAVADVIGEVATPTPIHAETRDRLSVMEVFGVTGRGLGRQQIVGRCGTMPEGVR
jgi:hypothetical protein